MRKDRYDVLDRIDRGILARLQEDARITAEAMAPDVGLSIAAVQRRIKRLREEGVIQKEIAVVDPFKLGQAMTFVVSVELDRERLTDLDDFERTMRSESHVQQCYRVTGTTDFVLILLAHDMTDFETFTRRALYENGNVRRFTTNVVTSRVKVGLSVPIDESE
ncbi:Lrp/AsnC family transcriptional regulator [Pendulispora brunnea]|uniref:Lrp/AsnC family transcriptional regulator n=1 Tax=Pendulispora brunnea TaxID=2905690 RepID=A0ABZ2K8F2_9BACT